jgi:hypothetical protein
VSFEDDVADRDTVAREEVVVATVATAGVMPSVAEPAKNQVYLVNLISPHERALLARDALGLDELLTLALLARRLMAHLDAHAAEPLEKESRLSDNLDFQAAEQLTEAVSSEAP